MRTDHNLPLRFLIGSRPKSHIRASFDHKSLYTNHSIQSAGEWSSTKIFILEEILRCFCDMACAYNSILSHVEQPWPEAGIVNPLVHQSSGRFIYAATVLKFIGAGFCIPAKQLALILKPDSSAFSDLDQLYTQILSVYPSIANIVPVLGIIMAFDEQDLRPEVIKDILGMEEGGLKLLLRGLSSLIAFNGDEGEYLTGNVISRAGRPYFLHASFIDFLVNFSPSVSFHVDRQKYTNQGAIWSFFDY